MDNFLNHPTQCRVILMFHSLMHTTQAQCTCCRPLVIGITNRAFNERNTDNLVADLSFRHFSSSVPRKAINRWGSSHGGLLLLGGISTVRAHGKLLSPH